MNYWCLYSLLTLKEAFATSILSRRWRYLWTFIPRLDFDGTETLLKIKSEEGIRAFKCIDEMEIWELQLDEKRRNYVRWVNHVMALHKGSTIEELRVLFDLTKTYQEYIDEWIRYALAHKVQRLELTSPKIGCKYVCYTFPYKLFCANKGDFSNSIDFKCLKKISMDYVNVNGEAVEFFLRNCPLLEHLSVSQSEERLALKIIGPFPSFKRLEISTCGNLNSVEIRDANLVYLKYNGSSIHFILENLPLLIEMYIRGLLPRHMLEHVRLLFSSYLSQLEISTMDISLDYSREEIEMFCSAVKMSNLKQLVVKMCAVYGASILPLTNLIRASPCMERFVLETSHGGRQHHFEGKAEKMVSSYPQLKEVEFVGYRGMECEVELVIHFLENAVALEEILVDPREPQCDINWMRNYGKEMSARIRAKMELSEIVPPRINLKIL